jgi:hypothetical protein
MNAIIERLREEKVEAVINDNYYFPSTTIKIPAFPVC